MIFEPNVRQKLVEYCDRYEVDPYFIFMNIDWYDEGDQMTFAMYLVYNKIIPPKEFEHNPKLTNFLHQTVAIILILNEMEVPNCWYYENTYILPDTNTTAMHLLKYEKIPPRYWLYNKLIQNDLKETLEILLAKNGEIRKRPQYHPADLQDKEGNTVALALAIKGIHPTREWYHDPFLRNIYGQTVYIMLKQNHLTDEMIDSYWNYIIHIEITKRKYATYITGLRKFFNNCKLLYTNINSKICEYIYDGLLNNQLKNIDNSIIQQIYIYKTTFPMFLAICGLEPEKDQIQRYQNILKFQDRAGTTAAMFYAYNNMKIHKDLKHDITLYNKFGHTIPVIIKLYRKQIPIEWQVAYDGSKEMIIDESGNTMIMLLAKQGIKPEKYLKYSRYDKNANGETVEIILSQQGIIPPKKWIIINDDTCNKIIAQNLLQWGIVLNQNQFKFNGRVSLTKINFWIKQFSDIYFMPRFYKNGKIKLLTLKDFLQFLGYRKIYIRKKLDFWNKLYINNLLSQNQKHLIYK